MEACHAEGCEHVDLLVGGDRVGGDRVEVSSCQFPGWFPMVTECVHPPGHQVWFRGVVQDWPPVSHTVHQLVHNLPPVARPGLQLVTSLPPTIPLILRRTLIC